jgi:2-iminobutanoate/2-iminopropanoate deaminase
VEAQTRQALANLSAVLSASGASMADVVKTTIFVVDIREFGTVNSIYGSAFPTPPPARSTVQVAALPLGGLVEIEAVALLPDGN